MCDLAERELRDHRPDGTGSYTNRIFGYDNLGHYTGTTSVSEAQDPWTCSGSGRFDPNYGEVGCAIDTVYTPYEYNYDGVGNRVGSGITNSGVGDQVSASDGISYTYDDDGKVVTRSQSSTGTEWTYDWSSDNRLLSSVSTVYGTRGKSTSFDYDALGRPVIKRSGSVPGSGHVIRATLYDGGTVLADLDSAGNREAEYVYDEGTDRPYAMLTGSTAVTGENFYVQNDMGHVDGLFKDTSHITETVTYGDWGLPITWGDTTNRFTWKGLSYDPDVGLTYMRSRWYDPNIGRFVSEDPLGLGGGINPYAFANDDPINGSDPRGMSAANGCTLVGYQYNWVDSGNGPTLDSVTPEYDCSSGGGNGTLPPMAPVDGVLVVRGGNGGASSVKATHSNTDACQNSSLKAAGVDIQQRLQNVNATMKAIDERTNGMSPVQGATAELMTFFNLVHTGGPYDDKNRPGPGTQQQRIDAGNISYGVTCSFGAIFCQAAAGANQTWNALLGHGTAGPLATYGDSPGDNASIKVGQAMRSAGCHG